MPRNLAELMHDLGPEFAARAARHNDDDLFVAENLAAPARVLCGTQIMNLQLGRASGRECINRIVSPMSGREGRPIRAKHAVEFG